MKELANQITNWIGAYATNNNIKALVVGVSGGIDSALVSTLCARTGLPTHVVVLPLFSKENETARGERHIEWLSQNFPNIVRHRVDLSDTFTAFKTGLPTELTASDRKGLAFANAKSRLRMVALYQVATIFSGIVVGTGNKVEDFGVGFFTKYGDGGVDISPIADLTKTEVRKMARDLGVLEEIVTVAPTDGLWDDARTDESQLGASYEELEWAMVYNSLPVNDRPEVTNRQFDVLETYNKWHKAGAHKLNPIPTFTRQ